MLENLPDCYFFCGPIVLFISTIVEIFNVFSVAAKLDGVNKPLRKNRTMEEYLQMEGEWQPPRVTKQGEKRVIITYDHFLDTLKLTQCNTPIIYLN